MANSKHYAALHILTHLSVLLLFKPQHLLRTLFWNAINFLSTNHDVQRENKSANRFSLVPFSVKKIKSKILYKICPGKLFSKYTTPSNSARHQRSNHRPLVFTRVTGAEDDRLKWYGWYGFHNVMSRTLSRVSLNSSVSSLAVVPQPQLWHLNWLPSVQSEGDCIHECRDAYPVVETHKRRPE